MTSDSSRKIVPRPRIRTLAQELHREGRRIVFTNGCFDIIHAGHIMSLEWARHQGDVLIVGVNSDASVRRLKGPGRPINPEEDRARVLAGMEAVDYVVLFGEDEPTALIGEILPDILVKGGDWGHYVSGREIVEKHGGQVLLAPLLEGRSTTGIIQRITRSAGQERETGDA
ncbi:MAG TPA: D-glycero-beta-D-manno-heptose 1-phosphate adenylyltransferase [Kiritimatiellae bacterium]|nr:D-glycero-beta-D-manno-heptose 1-phosphate adenylyltransferase [Kiritimatiellia bacterium]